MLVGTVTINVDNGQQIITNEMNAAAGGQVQIPLTNLSTGPHTILVTYHDDQDGNYQDSSASYTFSVVKAQTLVVVNAVDPNTGLSLTNLVSGQEVELTATILAAGPGSGVPTGTVNFSDTFGGVITKLGTPTLTTGVGIVAITDGGSGYTSAPSIMFTGGGGSGAAGIATINSAGVVTGVIITNPGSGYTSTPTVTFTSGGGSGAEGNAVLSGVASLTVESLVPGTHSISLSYNGDTNFVGNSCSPISCFVSPANSSTTISSGMNPSSPSETVIFTATVNSVYPSITPPRTER